MANERAALEIADRVTRLLGIPHEMLKGSWMKLECSVDPSENVWCELDHDGICWRLKLLMNILSSDEVYKNNMKWGLRLSETAIGCLVAKAVTTAEGVTDDGKINIVAACVLTKYRKAFQKLADS